MEHLRLFENYKSDEEIYEICWKYEIYDYSINKDGSVDVNENVYLDSMKLTELPLIFNEVNGDFRCDDNKLTTLKGSPRIVNGKFDCSRNNLTELKESPRIVNGDFNCSENELTSLKGSPKIANGSFYCFQNNLINLIGGPEEVLGRWYSCRDNESLTSLEGMAKIIGGSLHMSDCNLVDFKGIPYDMHIGENIFFEDNPVHRKLSEFLKKYDIAIFNIKDKYLDLILEINELDAIQDGKIIDIRMDEVIYNIGLI